MHLTIAYSKIKKQNLVLINNATYQRETLSERPIRQPLRTVHTLYFAQPMITSSLIYGNVHSML